MARKKKADFVPEVTMAKAAELVPYEKNARTHSDEQVAQIVKSIQEFGFVDPCLVDGEKGLIAGHGRLMAARQLGIEEVPVIEISHLTDKQKRALIIAHNKIAANAGWDMEALKAEIQFLAEVEFDLGVTGFEDSELITFLNLETEQEEGPKQRFGSNADGMAMNLMTDLRQIVLIMGNDEFTFLMDSFEQLQQELGLDNNTSVVLALTKAHLGVEDEAQPTASPQED